MVKHDINTIPLLTLENIFNHSTPLIRFHDFGAIALYKFVCMYVCMYNF